MRKLLIIFLLGSGLLSAQSFTVTLQPDGTTGMDNIVKTMSLTTNFASEATFECTNDAAGSVITRSLLQMDLSAIPPNAIISSAVLNLYGTGHSGTNPSYLRRNTASWNPATLTWVNMPATTTTGQVSLAQSTSGTQNYALDVTAFVQDMINIPAANFGWTIIKQSETAAGALVFGASDFPFPGLRPKLVITYSLPMNVKGYMTPATAAANADGGLYVTIANGVPPYTYSWSDGSSTKDITAKLPGLYTLIVTDHIGNQVKKHMMIGAENATITFSITPDNLSGKDAMIQIRDDGTLADNNYKDLADVKAQRATASGWLKSRSLLAYDISSLPSNAVINSATLQLYGDGHNPLNRPNTSYLYLNTQDWEEAKTTWATQPAHTTAGGIYLAGTSSTNENTSINVLPHVQGWVQDPSSNHGWKMLLTDEVTSSYSIRCYGSSDHATAGLHPTLVLSVTIPALTDAQRNWTMEETYDVNGNTSVQKVYTDNLGRQTQSLSQNADGVVFARQTVYDAYGRAAIQSLPAYTGTDLLYKTNLMLSNFGQEYNYTNFDVPGKITSPDPVQNSISNTLGNYYSDLNSYDVNQATTGTPYSRAQFMADPRGSIKTVNRPDDAFNAASGRETRKYSMVCGDELKYIFGSTNSYLVQTDIIHGNPLANTSLTLSTGYFLLATKNVTTSPDNKETVTYSVGNKVIATCMSGLSSPNSCSMTAVKSYMDWYGTQSVDIHVPDAGKSSVSFPLPSYPLYGHTFSVLATDIDYVITDQSNENLLQTPADYTINSSTRALAFSPAFLAAHAGKPLFLRIRLVYSPAFIAGAVFFSMPPGIVQYDLDYGRWSVNYYDLAGKLRKSVSPKGINCSSPGTVTMPTTYDYSHLGQLIGKKSADEGTWEYTYNNDGLLRFSQNTTQRTKDKFSYTNFDTQGRVVEKGEFTNNGAGSNNIYFQNYYNAYSVLYTGNTSSSFIINDADGLYDPNCQNVYHTSYETLSHTDDIPAAYSYEPYFRGSYRDGLVSKTWNENATTWYKYDPSNRLTASVQQINDADFTHYAGTGDAQIKTYQIVNNDNGTVGNTYFQKYVSNETVMHDYKYDGNQRLSTVYFSGAANPSSVIASFTYDGLGRLGRQVLGDQLQGIDYTYTLSGRLKAINHPALNPGIDPGQDSRDYSGGGGSGAFADLFGEIIEYYPGDYMNGNSNVDASTTGLYNGHIYGARYKTRNDVNGTITGADYIDYMGPNEVQLVNPSWSYYKSQELAKRYTYDVFGQLATSTFGTYNNSSGGGFTARTDYREGGETGGNIGYDVNGNLTRLIRNAYDDLSSGLPQAMDDLTYYYAGVNNRTTSVGDMAPALFPSSFNFSNLGSSAGVMYYDDIGRMISSDDDNIHTISYYPNGQVKQVRFNNGNTTDYSYNDQGQMYKTVLYDNASGDTKYIWHIFGTTYEYDKNVGSFDLKEVNMLAPGRVGVYKQDQSGIDLNKGHMEFELTDHLGNVRITFMAGSSSDLVALSVADYYAFGGPLPARAWQQSGGDYRYAYQGQQKSQDGVNWDEFELRLYNHDLGRWTAPDPYGQFNSPYLAMGNDPASQVDPDGGYINMSSQGIAQRKQFLDQLDLDLMYERGRFSYEFLYGNYKDDLERLRSKYLNGNDHDVGGKYTGLAFLEALIKLNNDYIGLGLGAQYLSSGTDYASASAIQSDEGHVLYGELNEMNGTAATAEAITESLYETNFDPFENSTDEWLDDFKSERESEVATWRKEKWANMNAEETGKVSIYVAGTLPNLDDIIATANWKFSGEETDIGNNGEFITRNPDNSFGGNSQPPNSIDQLQDYMDYSENLTSGNGSELLHKSHQEEHKPILQQFFPVLYLLFGPDYSGGDHFYFDWKN